MNVYLPDDLADRARAARLNVSAVTRAAIEAQLAVNAVSDWLARVAAMPSIPVEHRDVLAAVGAARDEFAGDDRG